MTGNTNLEHDPADRGRTGARPSASCLAAWQHHRRPGSRGTRPSPEKDSTIRTVLRRLEEKGYLAHSLENRAFVYRPAESPQLVAGRAVKRIVDWFCAGSVEALLVGMVDSKVLDRHELQRLANRIAAPQATHTERKSPRKKEEKP